MVWIAAAAQNNLLSIIQMAATGNAKGSIDNGWYDTSKVWGEHLNNVNFECESSNIGLLSINSDTSDGDTPVKVTLSFKMMMINDRTSICHC